MKSQNQKREIIESNIYRILPKLIRSSTLWTHCDPNIMILAQAILEIVCSQCSVSLQWESRKNFEKGP